MNLPLMEIDLLEMLHFLLLETGRAQQFDKLFVNLLSTSLSFENQNDNTLVLLFILALCDFPILACLLELFLVKFARINLSVIALRPRSNPDQ